MNKRMDDLREVSGTVTYSDQLTTFLYHLMRDELPAGVVEKIVGIVVSGPEECVFTNGWLAQYANNMAEEIKNARSNVLKDSLEKAFTEELDVKEKELVEGRLTEIVMNELRDEANQAGEVEFDVAGMKQYLTQDDYKKLESEYKKLTIDKINDNYAKMYADMDEIRSVDRKAKIRNSMSDEDCIKLESEIKEESRINQAEDDGPSVIDDVKEAVKQMVENGHYTQEEADALNEDIDAALTKPTKAVEIKKDNEGHKITAEEAKEMVDDAIEEADAIKNCKVSRRDARRINLKDITDKEMDKWKITNDELQKLEEENKLDEE